MLLVFQGTILKLEAVKLSKELDFPRKGLTNIQNIGDNDCFKWWLFRYSNPANYHPARIAKPDWEFSKKPDFKDVKCPFNIRDIHKIEKKKEFPWHFSGYENKVKHPIYVSKKMLWSKKTCGLVIDRRRRKSHYVIIKDFNTFMYDHSLHCGKKHFCRYYLRSFKASY